MYLMRFSIGKFPHNTISRLIKKPFYQTFLYFFLYIYFFLQKLFFSTIIFLTLFHAAFSCNSFVQLVCKKYHVFNENIHMSFKISKNLHVTLKSSKNVTIFNQKITIFRKYFISNHYQHENIHTFS